MACTPCAWADNRYAQSDNKYSQQSILDGRQQHRVQKMAGRAELSFNQEYANKMNEVPVAGMTVYVRPKRQLSVDERRALRQQINEARNMYGMPRP